VKVRIERQLSADAFLALDPAVARSNVDWFDVSLMLQGNGRVWNIGDTSFVFTIVNEDDEIEVLLAGGRMAADCVGPWEAAMVAHPAHQGLTLRVDGRKGWRRLLKHWDCDENGVLTLKV